MSRFSRMLQRFAVVQIAVLTFIGLATATSEAAHHGKKSNDIVDVAVAAGQLETLAAALETAGLVDTLKGDGPFTIFAPTDAAFAALPEGTVDFLLQPENKDELVAVLTYHVVPGKVMSTDVIKLDSAKTVNGAEVSIAVDMGKVRIDEATVVKADVDADNGVIHVIDTVILPGS